MPYCTEDMVAYPQSRVLVVCLGIGILLHDLHICQFDFGEDDEDSSTLDPATAHLQKSKLGWEHAQAVVQMCLTIAADLTECLGTEQEDHSSKTPSKAKKPSSKRQKKLPDRSDFYLQKSEISCSIKV
jgi:hypothetical protein